MSDPTQPTNGEPSPHIEKLLDAANSASQTVAALHVAFMAFAAYLGVIVWGTTDEALLLVSPVKLPILDVELPLTTFYGFVPWLLILLHFNLLIQLELLSRKLWNLDKDLPDTPAGQQIRDRLFIFPFTHMIAGRTSVWLIRWLLSMVVSVTVIALPLFILLIAQIRFLPYHDEAITWWQRGAVWTDVVMLFFLWPLIVSPNDDMWERWHKLWIILMKCLTYLHNWAIRGWNRLKQFLLNYWPGLNLSTTTARSMPKTVEIRLGLIVFLGTLSLAFLISIIAVVPGNTTVQTYYHPADAAPEDKSHFEDWLILGVPESWLSVVSIGEGDPKCTTLIPKPHCPPINPKQQIRLGGIFEWFNLGWFSRNLDLKEARLVPKDVSNSLLTKAIDPDQKVRSEAFKEFDGLKLKDRDLRFAILSDAVLPKADLRNVNLHGADLQNAHLHGAILTGAKLQNVSLSEANLQGSELWKADLQGADLWKADLQGAKLWSANLQGAELGDANLQGAELGDANLQRANLFQANLQDAELGNANLQGAVLIKANLTSASLMYGTNLQGAKLNEANLQGADLLLANLQGADLLLANLQGANLWQANLQGADLWHANLQGANLWSANLQGAYLLQADLQGADLLKAQLQGLDWSETTLNSSFMADNLKPYSKPSQPELLKLEATLKPLLDKKSFARFQQRMERAFNGLPPSGKPSRFKNCYIDNPTLLECAYNKLAQLDAYRSKLHSTLLELACSNAAVAEGIAKRSYYYLYLRNDNSNFNLAAALLKALDSPKTCAGLAALTEQTRQELRKVEERKKTAKLK